MQTLNTQVTQLLNSAAQIAQRQPQTIALLNQVYRGLFNEGIQQGCGNCYQKAFYRIQKYVYLQQQNHPTQSMIFTKREYLLKPGRSLQTTFGGDTLTNDNLTDEAAEKLIKTYPALIQHFEKHPLGQKPDSERIVVSSELEVVSDKPDNEVSSKLPVKKEIKKS